MELDKRFAVAANTIGTSIRRYANHNRYPWTLSRDRLPVVQATSTERGESGADRRHLSRPAIPDLR
jgi:hypothetical protein